METCRTCAKCDFENATTWLELFHPLDSWEHAFQQIRIEFSNWQLEIFQNDGLPQKICSDCFSKFCTVYSFRLQVQEAQNRLNNIFARIDPPSLEEEELTLKQSLEEAEDYAAAGKEEGREEATELDKVPLLAGQTDSDAPTNRQMEHAAQANVDCELFAASQLKDGEFAQPPENHTKSTVSAHTTDTYTATSVFNASAIDADATPSVTAEPDKVTTDNSNAHLLEIIASDNGVVWNEDAFNTMLHNDDDDDDVNDSRHQETGTDHNKCNRIDTNANQTTTASNQISFVFECKYCYKMKGTSTEHYHYHTQDALLAHICTSHDSANPYNCPHCEQGFQDAASRTVHVKSQHVTKQYNCEVCGKKYADRFNLRHHFEKYHSETDFECDLCEKRFYSRKSLNYHKKWHNPARQLKCSYCDRLFINQRHLQCHEVTHTGVRNAEYCSFCGKSFIHLKTLRWHIYRQHGGAKPFKCGSCSEEKRIHMLEHHLENLTSLERTECMLCHRRFETDADLKMHMTNEHAPGSASSATATGSSSPALEASARRRSATIVIANNKRVVQNKRAKHYSGIFQCDVCAQRFNMKSALERHSAVHSTEGRPHGCPQCQKRFKRAQDMNWHMKTHSNEKPNICDVCGKGFALKYVLNQHKRSHEVLEKNFVCATCGRAYLFEKSLRVHERTHTGKTYYKCDLCGESFVTHIKFKCHMRKMHVPARAENDGEHPLDELINIVIH